MKVEQSATRTIRTREPINGFFSSPGIRLIRREFNRVVDVLFYVDGDQNFLEPFRDYFVFDVSAFFLENIRCKREPSFNELGETTTVKF